MKNYIIILIVMLVSCRTTYKSKFEIEKIEIRAYEILNLKDSSVKLKSLRPIISLNKVDTSKSYLLMFEIHKKYVAPPNGEKVFYEGFYGRSDTIINYFNIDQYIDIKDSVQLKINTLGVPTNELPGRVKDLKDKNGGIIGQYIDCFVNFKEVFEIYNSYPNDSESFGSPKRFPIIIEGKELQKLYEIKDSLYLKTNNERVPFTFIERNIGFGVK